ncbi:hypothetical protein JMJ56_27935 [Belnapia sp. T18]|uniref:UrcA family protein n=1 Tax=Belnapia arida TaxID=2804533 RepID=A0ABS1UD01_9PROT|nr:hypothetical protein [Belnapia arida]MBL6081819.1 hypothetical protein [Belnapia arida]
MQRTLILLVAFAAAGQAVTAGLPPDVAAFVARRERCDHFRAEASDDPARAAAIMRGQEANCRGTDTELARLKRRHATDPGIRTLLDRYDPGVE